MALSADVAPDSAFISPFFMCFVDLSPDIMSPEFISMAFFCSAPLFMYPSDPSAAILLPAILSPSPWYVARAPAKHTARKRSRVMIRCK